MSYKYDVFLSYRRSNDWPLFVRRQFLPKLKMWLDSELGEARIFVDVEAIETGQSWPQVLADGVASSKVMVCLWTREYFTSKWCAEELGHMLARRQATATAGVLPPLVIGVIAHDGDDLPDEIADIQKFPLQKHTNPYINQTGKPAAKLSNKIKVLAHAIRQACDSAPPHDPEWHKLATDQFRHLFDQGRSGNGRPRLGDDE